MASGHLPPLPFDQSQGVPQPRHKPGFQEPITASSQGNRIWNRHLFAPADASDHVEQKVVAALGVDELAADGSLVGMHPGDVQSQPADDRETGKAVAQLEEARAIAFGLGRVGGVSGDGAE